MESNDQSYSFEASNGWKLQLTDKNLVISSDEGSPKYIDVDNLYIGYIKYNVRGNGLFFIGYVFIFLASIVPIFNVIINSYSALFISLSFCIWICVLYLPLKIKLSFLSKLEIVINDSDEGADQVFDIPFKHKKDFDMFLNNFNETVTNKK